MRTFGNTDREEFRKLIKATPLDETAAADEASRLSTAWLEPWRGDATPVDLGRCLEHKVAGYNGDIHQWVRRVRRAAAAADTWLGVGAINLEFQLPDLLLGEYFLLQRVIARGGTLVTRTPLADLVTRVLKAHPPQCERQGFEHIEVSLRPQAHDQQTVQGAPLSTLFVATMANYLNPMIPVMEELIRTGRRVAVLTPRESGTWSNWMSVPAVVERLTFEGQHNAESQSRLDAESEHQIKLWNRRARTVAGSFMVAGIDLWPLVARDIEHMIKVYIPYACSYAQITRDIVERRAVKTVVCARLRRAAECAAAQAAQNAGARCMVLMHGHISERPQRRFEDGSFSWAQRVCAWGPQQQEALLAKGQGITAEQVVVTGNPDWDRLSPVDQARRVVARAMVAGELSLDAAACWVTVATQQDSRPQFEAIARVVLAEAGTVLLVKVHPRENARDYAKVIAPEQEPRVRIISAEPRSASTALHNLLLASDALLTFHSTTNIEALLLGTPVITVALDTLAAIDRLAPLEPYGLPLATSVAQLVGLVAELAKDPAAFQSIHALAMERAINAIAGHRTGAAARVCELLAALGVEAA